jgi:bifunctional DNase/RNase
LGSGGKRVCILPLWIPAAISFSIISSIKFSDFSSLMPHDFVANVIDSHKRKDLRGSLVGTAFEKFVSFA